ncbi:hypothetical protein HK405_015871, partial [Cladochytrium tenue]
DKPKQDVIIADSGELPLEEEDAPAAAKGTIIGRVAVAEDQARHARAAEEAATAEARAAADAAAGKAKEVESLTGDLGRQRESATRLRTEISMKDRLLKDFETHVRAQADVQAGLEAKLKSLSVALQAKDTAYRELRRRADAQAAELATAGDGEQLRLSLRDALRRARADAARKAELLAAAKTRIAKLE